MCLGCWEGEGKPYKVTDAVRQWAPKFADANEFGPLHIVVGDWNLDDHSLAFCRTESPSQDEVALLDALEAMSEGERWATAILAIYPDFDPTAPLD